MGASHSSNTSFLSLLCEQIYKNYNFDHFFDEIESHEILDVDSNWMKLLKIRVVHLSPKLLSFFVKEKVLNKFLSQNDITGNFRSLMKFVTKILKQYRTQGLLKENEKEKIESIKDEDLINLLVFFRCLMKELTDVCTPMDLLFHFEHTPITQHLCNDNISSNECDSDWNTCKTTEVKIQDETRENDKNFSSLDETSSSFVCAYCKKENLHNLFYDNLCDNSISENKNKQKQEEQLRLLTELVKTRKVDLFSTIKDKHVRFIYRGKFFVDIPIDSMHSIRDLMLNWFEKEFPQDVWILILRGFVFRRLSGKTVFLTEVVEVVTDKSFEGILYFIPLGVPQPSLSVFSFLCSSCFSFTFSSLSLYYFNVWNDKIIPSTLSHFMLEVAEFCVLTQCEATYDSGSLVAQQVLLEVLLSIFSFVYPKSVETSSNPLKKEEGGGCREVSISSAPCNVVSVGCAKSNDGVKLACIEEAEEEEYGGKNAEKRVLESGAILGDFGFSGEEGKAEEAAFVKKSSLSDTAAKPKNGDTATPKKLVEDSPISPFGATDGSAELAKRETGGVDTKETENGENGAFDYYNKILQEIKNRYCHPPNDLSSQLSYIAPLYYLYLQEIQPFPQLLSPSVSVEDALLPAFCFLEIFIDLLLEPHNYTHTFHFICGSQVKQKIFYNVSKSSNYLALEFATYLLNVLWLSLSNLSSYFQFSCKLIPEDLIYCCLSILVLLTFSPSPSIRKNVQFFSNRTTGSAQATIFAEAFSKVCDCRYFIEYEGKQEKSLKTDAENEKNSSLSSLAAYTINSENKKVKLRCMNVDFDKLFVCMFSDRLSSHLYPFLLYALIYQNRFFKIYCLSKCETEKIFFPILRILYKHSNTEHPSCNDKTNKALAVSSSSNLATSTYQSFSLRLLDSSPCFPSLTVLLLVFLLLTEDKNIAFVIHKTIIEEVEWYHSIKLNDISIGNLSTLIILKLISWNFRNFRDIFIHQACSAILINISPYSQNVHCHVADKLMESSILLIKQLSRKLSLICNNENKKNGENNINEPSVALYFQIEAISVVLRGVLECICRRLIPPHIKKNINLLYSFIRSYSYSLLNSILSLFNSISLLQCSDMNDTDVVESNEKSAWNDNSNNNNSDDSNNSYNNSNITCKRGDMMHSNCSNNMHKMYRKKSLAIKKFCSSVEVFLQFLQEILIFFSEEIFEENFQINESGNNQNDDKISLTIEQYKERLSKAAMKISTMNFFSDVESSSIFNSHFKSDSNIQSNFGSTKKACDDYVKRTEKIKMHCKKLTRAHHFFYSETHNSSCYFLPLLWKTIYYLQPNHVSWNI